MANLTVKDISKLLNEKFKLNNEILLRAFDKEIGSLTARVGTLENNSEDLNSKLDRYHTETTDKLDQIIDRLNSLDDRLFVQSQRVHKLEKNPFVSV